ncbi:hypothetical protein PUNSTDRAFT_139368 [Punctularia strigosozonata HHB-11173 SS5]|uniref:REJ domain-containing protein n=1 Tax=Punctularia strigosozonata (strain HHB-11173) TaxID=741275 RepID=R7S0Q0_PUNST|nr:uncharacterized protein PUNSTDRAFT_139368 [Punctularia strigosozonata HHB-11173 SS5]XP_007389394.1 uncharacterized protein PUNSTDRAFT_139606 [Punctularia strigosozonata HHB-11173 SS5]EIN03377.1 hypothetical protein PUNSTDRAFT_139606 [Punctularia strigosozonata HHB-11173 SS5]EIN03652.1 hypothetical protein PUNSTDRAFT_139368 [Punctularia strigosozonata HHB-11173 SS5]
MISTTAIANPHLSTNSPSSSNTFFANHGAVAGLFSGIGVALVATALFLSIANPTCPPTRPLPQTPSSPTMAPSPVSSPASASPSSPPRSFSPSRTPPVHRLALFLKHLLRQPWRRRRSLLRHALVAAALFLLLCIRRRPRTRRLQHD